MLLRKNINAQLLKDPILMTINLEFSRDISASQLDFFVTFPSMMRRSKPD